MSRRPWTAPRRQRGYSLIEVIVAFSLLALALSLLLGSLSGASRQVRWAGDAGRAALHAQSLLAGVGVEEALRPGTRGGELEDGRYRWSLRADPWQDPLLPPVAGPDGARLMALELTVEWGDGGPREQLVLHSLRLAPPEGAGP